MGDPLPPFLVLGLLAEGVDLDDVAAWEYDEETHTYKVRLRRKVQEVLMTVSVE